MPQSTEQIEILKKLWRILLKSLFGIISLFIILLLLILTPPVQRFLTSEISEYLTNKTGGKVSVTKVRAYPFGKFGIFGFEVCDPEGDCFLEVDQFNMRVKLIPLLSGIINIDDIQMTGVQARLDEREDGLNISYLINAFSSNDKDSSAQIPIEGNGKPLRLNNLRIKDLDFRFYSYLNQTDLKVLLGTLLASGIDYNDSLRLIGLRYFELENSNVELMMLTEDTLDSSKHVQDQQSRILPSFDFGSGLTFDVEAVKLRNNTFEVHTNEVLNPSKFDPAHIVFQEINLDLSNILLSQDSIKAKLDQSSLRNRYFSLSSLSFDIAAGLKQLNLAGFKIEIPGSNIQMEANVTYENWTNLLKDHKQAIARIALQGHMDHPDLSYFLSDSQAHFSNDLPILDFIVDADYSNQTLKLPNLEINSANSRIALSGKFYSFFELDSIYWQDLKINVTMSSELRNALKPVLGGFVLPPMVYVDISTSGRVDSLNLNGKLQTSWGNILQSGHIGYRQNSLWINTDISTEEFELSKWTGTDWLGPLSVSIHTQGSIDNNYDVNIDGFIPQLSLFENPFDSININSNISENILSATINVQDSNFPTSMDINLSFKDSISINGIIEMDQFKMGKLLKMENEFVLSGKIKSQLAYNDPRLDGVLNLSNMNFKAPDLDYQLDSVRFHFDLSPDASTIDLYSDKTAITYNSNFYVGDIGNVLKGFFENYLPSDGISDHEILNRQFNFDIATESPALFYLANIPLEQFSGFEIRGAFDEQNQKLEASIKSNKLKGNGIGLDTISGTMILDKQSIFSRLEIAGVTYDSLDLGSLDLKILTHQDTSYASGKLVRDSVILFSSNSRFLWSEDYVSMFVDSLIAFNANYIIDQDDPILIETKNVSFNRFSLSKNDILLTLYGDLEQGKLEIRNADLIDLNYLIDPDSSFISSGNIDVLFEYNRLKDNYRGEASIEKLAISNYPPINALGTVYTEKSGIPFELKVRSDSNMVDLKGTYLWDQTDAIDAYIFADLRNIEILEIILKNYINDVQGHITVDMNVDGSLDNLNVDGALRLENTWFTLSKPKTRLGALNEVIKFDNHNATLSGFSIVDPFDNSVEVNGSLNSQDYNFLEYDLNLKTDNFVVINNPYTEEYRMQGILVVSSDIKLTGNSKNTYADALVTIKDTTNVSIINPPEEIELITNEGIVEFVDPSEMDAQVQFNSSSLYDSLINSLPNFNLNSTIILQEGANLKFTIDPQSGDYIEASGTANLEFGYDRTGKVRLNGIYQISEGNYQLSFYDIVRKKFIITTGSNITWNGDPYTGDLNVKALHIIKTSSIGLIGHEVGENEKALYRRALPYEVGIVIAGSVQKPEISFTLELPQEEKINYPALANKLSRLRQPEYESELNKQVFGLLVLGGFIPESSDSELNQSLIATTAISNSVNSLLASQLNRFTSQYVKGVDIDVGLQSYSDYSTGTGRTRTAMDFRVTKRMLDDRLSFEVGGGMDITTDQSGPNTGSDNFRGDVAIIYDLTESGNKQLKGFNNETYDIIYHQVRNTGVSLIFIREFDERKKDN